ncbi:MAG: hypothetical protein ACREGL_04715 [Alphaproteobacteria bacterium]
MWRDHDEPGLTAETLQALFDNGIPAIRIPGFASGEECRAFSDAVAAAAQRRVTFSAKDGHALSRPDIGYLGIFQHYYRHKDKSAYFADVPAAISERDRIFGSSFDPIARMIGHLRRAAPGRVELAAEDGLGPYYAGIIRTMTVGAPLHCDFHRFYARGYRIGAIDAQIGWNIYAAGSGDGGELVIHNRPWTPEVKGGEMPESFPLPRELVEGAERHEALIRTGDVIIFNTRNPHEIRPNNDDEVRVSLGTFVGRLPGGDILLWS